MEIKSSLIAPGLVPWLLVFGLAACNSNDTPSRATTTTEANRGAPNILVLIADDAGNALVNTTDVYATIVELAGASLPDDRPLDSVSLMPYFANPGRESIRTYQLAEFFHSEYGASAGEYAIGNGDHKLIGRHAGHELYDLGADLSESNNLLADGISAAEQEIVDRLEATVEDLRRSE